MAEWLVLPPFAVQAEPLPSRRRRTSRRLLQALNWQRFPDAASIRSVSVAVAVAVTVGLGAVLVGAGVAVRAVLGGVEREQVAQDVVRARRIVERHLVAQRRTVQEFAFWDEAWNYVDRPNGATAERFVRDNYVDWIPRQYGVGLIAIADRNRKRIFTWSDSSMHLSEPVFFSDSLFDALDRRAALSGLLRTRSSVVMVAGAVVVRTADQEARGPRNGYVVLGWPVADSLLATLGGQLGGRLHLLPSVGVQARHVGARRSAGGDSLETRFLLEDAYGRPDVIAQLAMSRAYFRSMERWVFGYFGTAALIGVVLLVLMILAGNRLVARLVEHPLREMASAFERMEESGRLEEIPKPAQSREWALLASGFNAAVAALQASETQLRQAQKLEAIGTFAGGIAHDFNNVLTTILMTAEVLRGELPATSGQVADLENIRRAGERGADLTKKLLAFGRRQQLEFRTIALAGVLSGFVGMVRRLVPATVDITYRADDPGPTVRADAGAVEQIALNLVTNARDAMPAGGAILIEVGRRTLDEQTCAAHGWGSPGAYAVLTVSDTGCGMNDETLRKIFEPFFTTKPVGEGTGLGMAIVYGLVKAHDGFVHVYSEVGRGTTMRVYFPATADAAVDASVDASDPEVVGGTETILVAEDEPSLRVAARRVLRKHGYTVLTASDGVEALEIYRARRGEIDMVVSDVVMPRLGGVELLRELRNERAPVKVLLTSGYAAPFSDSLPSNPPVPVLTKPWTVPSLLRRIREVLDGQVDPTA